MSTKMKTASGALVDLVDLKPSDIKLRDVSLSLARQCRFNGHNAISVARHSINVFRNVAQSGDYRRNTKLAALLHDAHEAYLGDITRPVRNALPDHARAQLEDLESVLQDVIIAWAGITPTPAWSTIQLADAQECQKELIAWDPVGTGDMWQDVRDFEHTYKALGGAEDA